jgi:hypothetical protein
MCAGQDDRHDEQEEEQSSRLSRRRGRLNWGLDFGGFSVMVTVRMFETIKEQLPVAADKVAHLRRFL